MTLERRFPGTIRGGIKRNISFAKYLREANEKGSCLRVEKFVLPQLGEGGWGYVQVREGGTTSIHRFRR